jgi:membrane-associated phospholipid phosphatase
VRALITDHVVPGVVYATFHHPMKQANEIAAFFAPHGDDRAVPQIADHVTKFWDPRMRARMAAHLTDGGTGLHPLALTALSGTSSPADELAPLRGRRYASQMSRRAVARVLSIAGHPALVVPGALFMAVAGDAPARAVRTAVMPAALVAAAVMVYSLVQVRRGKWSHVDASVRTERRQLNLVLAAMLGAAAAALGLAGQPRPVVVGMASAAVLVAVAHAARQWLKTSLHVSFAIFGAAFLWPRVAAMLLLVGLAIAVGWSRLVLGRHTPVEVIAGGLLGIAAGALFLAVR